MASALAFVAADAVGNNLGVGIGIVMRQLRADPLNSFLSLSILLTAVNMVKPILAGATGL